MANIFYSPTGRARLLKTYEKCDMSAFDDLLHCCAVTIENAMLMSGATPIIDYSILDVFKLATPLAQGIQTELTTITAGIPNNHPHSGLSKNEYLAIIEKDVINLEPEVLLLLKERGKPIMSQTLGGIFRKRGGIPMQKAAIRALHALIEKKMVRRTPQESTAKTTLFELA